MLELTEPLALVFIALLGLFAGAWGGLLGVGGSVIMIPGLTMLLGRDQHVFQAAAMIVNVAVAIPAARKHYKAGALRPDVLKFMLPAAVFGILVGVALSNLEAFAGRSGGVWLGRILALFLLYVIYANVEKLIGRHIRIKRYGYDPRSARDTAAHEAEVAATHEEDSTSSDSQDGSTAASMQAAESAPPTFAKEKVTPVRSGVIGSSMGLIAGLLGIGGGALAVPMQQTFLKIKLRSCIANSSTVMCISAPIGAIYKNLSLAQHAHPGDSNPMQHSLLIAAMLAPTAWLGGRLGASLTHRLPTRYLRAAFILLMVLACWKMAALEAGWRPGQDQAVEAAAHSEVVSEIIPEVSLEVISTEDITTIRSTSGLE